MILQEFTLSFAIYLAILALLGVATLAAFNAVSTNAKTSLESYSEKPECAAAMFTASAIEETEFRNFKPSCSYVDQNIFEGDKRAA